MNTLPFQNILFEISADIEDQIAAGAYSPFAVLLGREVVCAIQDEIGEDEPAEEMFAQTSEIGRMSVGGQEVVLIFVKGWPDDLATIVNNTDDES